MKKLWALMFCLFLTSNIFGSGTNFIFTDALNEAQELIILVKLDKAEQIIRSEKLVQPNNIAADYLLAYVEYYRVLTSQKKSVFEHFIRNISYYQNRYNNLPNESPYKLYCQAQLNLQLSFSKALFNEYLGSAWSLRSAYVQIGQNNKKFPSFEANNKNIGLLHAMVGTLPDNYRWIVNAVGLKGTFKEGMTLLKGFAFNNKSQPLLDVFEAKMLYVLLTLHFADNKQEALTLCAQHFNNSQSMAHTFISAYVALEAKNPSLALTVLNRFHPNNDYPDFYFIDYLQGKARLFSNTPGADISFKKYVSFYKGNFLVKDSYKKLSWYYLINHDTLKYNTYRLLSLKDKTDILEEDKNNQVLISKNKLPNATIMQARMLFDGGNSNKALQLLLSLNPDNLEERFEKIEYHYRMGRIYYEQKMVLNAIESFNLVLNLSKGTTTHMAPYAAYYLGRMYKQMGYKETADKYFKLALDFDDYDYESTVKQKVKAAMNN